MSELQYNKKTDVNKVKNDLTPLLGKQVDILAESVTRRYFQSQNIRVDYPEYCYQGEYVKHLARRLNLVDIPHSYKTHKKPTPFIGGLGVYLAFTLTIFFILGATRIA